MRAVPCALVFRHGQRPCRADLRPGFPGCRVATDARAAARVAPRAVPARDRRAVARSAPGPRGRRPGLVLGCGRGRHRDRLAATAERGARRDAWAGLGALVGRRRVRLCAGCHGTARGHRSRGRGARLGGRGWRGPPADQRRAPGRDRRSRPPLPRTRDSPRGPGRDPAPTAAGNRGDGPRARPDRCDLHPDLLGLRRPGRGHAARRLRRKRARHGRRIPPTRFVGAAQGRRGRGRGARADGSPDPRRPPRGRRRRRGVEPGSRRLVARRTGSARRGITAPATRLPDRPRDAVPAHLHVGHDRPAEGRRPRARRLPDQGRPGPRPPVRPARRRHAVLVHRPRLDDGPVGHLRGAAARRPPGALRGRPGLPRPGPPVVDRRTPQGHPPRPLADRHPRAHGARRGAGPEPRPRLAARPRLDRRAVEPGAVVVVFPRGRRRPLPDRQLLGWDGGQRRHRQREPADPDQADRLLRVRASGRPRTSSTTPAGRCATRWESW